MFLLINLFLISACLLNRSAIYKIHFHFVPVAANNVTSTRVLERRSNIIHTQKNDCIKILRIYCFFHLQNSWISSRFLIKLYLTRWSIWFFMNVETNILGDNNRKFYISYRVLKIISVNAYVLLVSTDM